MTDPVTVEPCPFCGDTPEIAAIPTAIALMLHHPPGDRRCPLSDKVFLGNAWNTRASPSREPGEDEVERVEAAIAKEWNRLKACGPRELAVAAIAALTLPEQPRPVDPFDDCLGVHVEANAMPRPVDDVMREALEKCRAQFDFYAREHRSAQKFAKAETNQQFADLCCAALGHKDRGGE